MKDPLPYAFAIWITSIVIGGILFILPSCVSSEGRFEGGSLFFLLVVWFVSAFFSYIPFTLFIFTIPLVDSIRVNFILKLTLLSVVAVIFCGISIGLASLQTGLDNLPFWKLLSEYSLSLIFAIFLWNRDFIKIVGKQILDVDDF